MVDANAFAEAAGSLRFEKTKNRVNNEIPEITDKLARALCGHNFAVAIVAMAHYVAHALSAAYGERHVSSDIIQYVKNIFNEQLEWSARALRAASKGEGGAV